MLEGVMLLWFIQVVLGVLFVAIDIRTTPEAAVMKWGFVIITAFSGLFGALLYVLNCREPLPGTHELYVAAKWRQVVGSTMHCVAGDGIGILAAAVITSGIGLPMWADVLCEYGLGFLFGWTVFQALFMKSMFSSYRESLSRTFMSELLSMNAVMGGMTAVMVPWMTYDMTAMHPTGARFWFVMSRTPRSPSVPGVRAGACPQSPSPGDSSGGERSAPILQRGLQCDEFAASLGRGDGPSAERSGQVADAVPERCLLIRCGGQCVLQRGHGAAPWPPPCSCCPPDSARC